jgi:2-polyprenyl-3-methyl-5-hydroxy-6-metoxy-1,4-benzoquinol methylase
MLAEARRRWPEGPAPEFSLIERGESPFEDGTFDVVVVCSVLHHVEPMLRFLAYEDIARLLKPGGHVCVFEHNPYNPVTQWVVRHTSIDRNAVLLRPAEVRASLANAGITRAETHYLMFAPPKLKFCRMLDRVLSWLPLGAQYAVCATRE